MVRTKVILVLCFLAAFAAGTTAGFVVRGPEGPRRGRSWLMEELKLTEDQRERMRKIWSETMDASGRQYGEQRRAAAEERDKALAALLTPVQQAEHELIRQAYDRRLAELSAQRKLAFDQAVDRTKKEVLTPEQGRQYDEILKKQRERGAGPQWGGPRGRGGPRSRPATDESNAPRVGE